MIPDIVRVSTSNSMMKSNYNLEYVSNPPPLRRIAAICFKKKVIEMGSESGGWTRASPPPGSAGAQFKLTLKVAGPGPPGPLDTVATDDAAAAHVQLAGPGRRPGPGPGTAGAAAAAPEPPLTT